MYKFNVSVPAVSTNVGPGYDVLGLALNLRNVVEMSLSPNDELAVQVKGEGKGTLPENYYNPAMTAAIRLFQQLEQAPAGLNVICTNYIPLDVGLSARVAMTVGGLVGANNLLGNPYRREDLIGLATELSGQPEAVVTALRGGLGICSSGPDGVFYRAIEVASLRVVLAIPAVPDFAHKLRADLPERVPMEDAVHNIGHAALLIEALRAGDTRLLRYALDDRLHEAARGQNIPGYEGVVAAAKGAGALGVVLCGAGPALLVFTAANHQLIESAVQDAFKAAGVECRTMAVSVDSQGVVISVVQ
jgi:homoserine kinase